MYSILYTRGRLVMFYCDKCAEKRGWVTSIAKSHGKCEVCEKIAFCNDVSRVSVAHLPTKGKKKCA